MAGVRLLLVRWRADAGLLAVVVVVVALTAGLVGAVPRLLDRLALASLDAAVDGVTVDRSGLAASSVQELGGGTHDDVRARLDTLAADLDAGLDAELQAALGPPTTLLETVRYDLRPLPGEPADGLTRKLTLRLQPGMSTAVLGLEGDLPDGVVGDVALEVAEGDETVTATFPVHEFLATAATADALGLAVGDRRVAVPDPSGPVLQRVRTARVAPVVVELVGLVQLSPLDDPVWFGDPRLHRASRFDTNTGSTVFATGLVPEGESLELPGMAAGQVASVDVRWPLDRAGLLASDRTRVEQAAVALRSAPALLVDQPTWSTGLDRLLVTEAARRATAVEVLGLAAVAITGVAGALLLAVVTVLAQRRRDHLALVRGRGASRVQLVVAALVEFGAVTLAGLVLAVSVLAVVLPGATDWTLPIAVAALALLLLVVGGLRDARRRLGALLAERGRTSVPPRRQHVWDGLLVLVAVVAVTSLRRRGVTLDGTVDPLVVAAPVLFAAAAAVVAARLAPLPLRAAEVAARRRRGVALPVGLARAARSHGGGTVVVLLVLGLGVAGLAAAVHESLVDGQRTAATERVGADVRVTAPPLGSLAPVWSPPSPSDRVAELRALSRVPLVAELTAQRVDVVLVDPEELAAVGADEGLEALAWDGLGAAPLLASEELTALGTPAPGAELTLAVDDVSRVVVEFAGVVPRALGRDGTDGAFVLLDRRAVEVVTGVEAGVTTRLVATDDPDAVVAAARDSDPDATVLVREEVATALRTAPLAAGVRVGFLVAAAAAVVATAVALVLALVAGAPQRRRQAAVLGALGTSTRAVRTALLAEVLPVVAGAAVTGIALAGAVAVLLGERLDLAPFTGSAGQVALVLPPWWVALWLVVGAVVVAGCAAVVTQGRVDPGALLREGD